MFLGSPTTIFSISNWPNDRGDFFQIVLHRFPSEGFETLSGYSQLITDRDSNGMSANI